MGPRAIQTVSENWTDSRQSIYSLLELVKYFGKWKYSTSG